jgi:hypothetical protein
MPPAAQGMPSCRVGRKPRSLRGTTAVLMGIATAAQTAGAHPASVAVTWAGDLEFVMPGTVFADSSSFDRLYAAARAAFPGILVGGGSFASSAGSTRRSVGCSSSTAPRR